MWGALSVQSPPELCTQLLLVLRVLASASGQIPRLCAGSKHLASRQHCPCLGLMVVPGQLWWDFRLGWPRHFFDELRACEPHYSGSNCGECADGWPGSRCQLRCLVEQQDLWKMGAPEQELFLDCLLLAKRTVSPQYLLYSSPSAMLNLPFRLRDASLYNIFSWVHYLYSKDRGDDNPSSFAHKGPGFPSWPHAFLLAFEPEMCNLTGDQDFYVPYLKLGRTTRL
ncbi:tyrosinase-like [Mobula hypostoma]|uniref:tyrosinase-like n=1 Tax=Mobula hypostoma TaxID=723540 RepID=UPI002FC2BB3D